jgi:hypothetical protein
MTPDASVVAGTGFKWSRVADADDGAICGSINWRGITTSGDTLVGDHVFDLGAWTRQAHCLNLVQYLTDHGVDLTGWSLLELHGMSGDGRVIVGVGRFNGLNRAWMLTGTPVVIYHCVADVCGVGAIYDQGAVDVPPDGHLTIEDFLIFLSAFGDAGLCPGGTPCNPADICGIGATYDNGAVDVGPDGQLTIEDFLIFLSAFGDATSCP